MWSRLYRLLETEFEIRFKEDVHVLAKHNNIHIVHAPDKKIKIVFIVGTHTTV